MPFRSKAQQRWAHTAQGEAALGGPAKVAEWQAATVGTKLPDYVQPRLRVGTYAQTSKKWQG